VHLQGTFTSLPKPSKRIVFGIATISLFLVASAAYARTETHATIIMPTGNVVATLHSTHQSGVAGTATLTPNGRGFTISIALQGATVYPAQGATMPPRLLARIRTVSCNAYARLTRTSVQRATVEEVLLAVSNGQSVTQINGRVSRVATGTYSISVQEAGSPYRTIACGDIPYLSSSTPVGDAPCTTERALAQVSRCYPGDLQ
jgi:hypothetical protein